MKLISCHIENFGKLQEFDYSFDSEKSIIHEDNGWGKSTLATFIRVMFFGFEGDSKRGISDNERKKYYPWQMGVYGGNLIFSVNDKEYRLERYFGVKKSGADKFALYDNKTNLISDDYSSNIGEELFGINSKSFMKTVFIAQQDCTTEATPDINAKIGNVSDQTADMGNYDAVQESLKKEMDKLTPDRITGRLKKLDMKISELKDTIRSKDNYVRNLAELEGNLNEQVSSKNDKLRERKEVQQQIEIVSAKKDVMAGAERYKELCNQVVTAKQTYDSDRNYFPGELPSKEDIEKALGRCDDCETYRSTVSNFKLSTDEVEKLSALEEHFGSEIPDEAVLNDLEEKIDSISELEAERDSSSLSDAEKKKYDEAKLLFDNYKPTVEEIDRLYNDWSERKSKKEALSTKKVSAQVLKSTCDATKNKGHTKKSKGIISLIVAIVLILFGVLACAGGAIGGIAFIAVGIIIVIFRTLRRNKGKENEETTDREDNGYIQLMKEISEDEEYIHHVEQECRSLFDKLDISFNEYDVPAELRRIGGLVKDYDELEDRIRRCDSDEREKEIRRLETVVVDSFRKYKYAASGETEYSKLFFCLKDDVMEFGRLRDKQKKANDAADEVERIGNEIKDYLRKIGFEPVDDLKEQLSTINKKCIALEFSKDAYDKSEQKKIDFEKENDVSKYETGTDAVDCISLEDLNAAFNSLTEEINSIKELEDNFKDQIEDVVQKLEDIENDEAELNTLLEEYENASRKYQILGKTRDYLKKAKHNFSSRYMDDIKKSFEKYHDMISDSDDKYKLDANLNIQIQEKGSLHEIVCLSEGYKDLVGLCRRMAMIDAMYDLEKPFLIFDDPFVNLDDSKLDGAMDFLDAISKNYQIVYFACHQSRCN